MGVAWRSQGVAGEELVFAGNLRLDEGHRRAPRLDDLDEGRQQGVARGDLVLAVLLRLEQGQCRAAGLADLYEALRHLTARYQAMNLSAEEAVTLKAMALANSGTTVSYSTSVS